MRKQHCEAVGEALITAIGDGAELRELIWNYDPVCSQKVARSFAEQLTSVKSQLTRLEMCGVF